MPLAGKTLLPRDIAAELIKHQLWNTFELTKGIAVTLGESAGSVGAWHDNDDGLEPDPDSRDCGLMQINIAARFIGTDVEQKLRTEDKNPTVYGPVVEKNIEAGYVLYNQSWIRHGIHDIRRWNPWVAYNTGWATFPYAWVWHRTENGQPIENPHWVPTGRYIHRAIAGQMNYHIVIKQDWNPTKALNVAKQYYIPRFGIKQATYSIVNGVIAVKYDPAPSTPPQDGIGPRPVPNDGV